LQRREVKPIIPKNNDDPGSTEEMQQRNRKEKEVLNDKTCFI